jgi:HD-like signal output (HDOD) protein
MSATPGPTHVLFVDDQPEVLAGLRTSLHRERRHFISHFATDADGASTALAEHPITVLVTDLKMPSTSGIEVLHRTARDHPDVVRYVLTGDGKDMIMEALPKAHRCLTKPCTREQLLGALHEAVRFRQLITDPAIQQAVTGLGSLPSTPAMYARIMDLCADDGASAEDVADLIADDTALTAKLLAWGNSAFGGASRVRSVADAITRVGLRPLTQLVVSLEMEGAFEQTPAPPGLGGGSTLEFARHVGERAWHAAPAADRTAARVAGVLSIAGLLLESTALPDRLAEDHEQALAEGRPLVEIERERHGVSHAEICGHLLAVWGLPADVATAAASAWYPPTTFGGQPDLAAAVQLGRISAAVAWSSAAHQSTDLDAATQRLLAAADDIGRVA